MEKSAKLAYAARQAINACSYFLYRVDTISYGGALPLLNRSAVCYSTWQTNLHRAIHFLVHTSCVSVLRLFAVVMEGESIRVHRPLCFFSYLGIFFRHFFTRCSGEVMKQRTITCKTLMLFSASALQISSFDSYTLIYQQDAKQAAGLLSTISNK